MYPTMILRDTINLDAAIASFERVSSVKVISYTVMSDGTVVVRFTPIEEEVSMTKFMINPSTFKTFDIQSQIERYGGTYTIDVQEHVVIIEMEEDHRVVPMLRMISLSGGVIELPV